MPSECLTADERTCVRGRPTGASDQIESLALNHYATPWTPIPSVSRPVILIGASAPSDATSSPPSHLEFAALAATSSSSSS
jgi:hypothetical protein